MTPSSKMIVRCPDCWTGEVHELPVEGSGLPRFTCISCQASWTRRVHIPALPSQTRRRVEELLVKERPSAPSH